MEFELKKEESDKEEINEPNTLSYSNEITQEESLDFLGFLVPNGLLTKLKSNSPINKLDINKHKCKIIQTFSYLIEPDLIDIDNIKQNINQDMIKAFEDFVEICNKHFDTLEEINKKQLESESNNYNLMDIDKHFFRTTKNFY